MNTYNIEVRQPVRILGQAVSRVPSPSHWVLELHIKARAEFEVVRCSSEETQRAGVDCVWLDVVVELLKIDCKSCLGSFANIFTAVLNKCHKHGYFSGFRGVFSTP